jgi:hypothetical protein
MLKPRLRTVEKREPPHRPNQFPPGFDDKLGRELVCQLATAGPALEGAQWEAIILEEIGFDESWVASVPQQSSLFPE